MTAMVSHHLDDACTTRHILGVFGDVSVSRLVVLVRWVLCPIDAIE